MTTNKRLLKKIETIRHKVEAFNADLENYYKISGDRSLPIIEATIYGFDPFEPYAITDIEGGFRAEADGFTYDITVETDEDGEEYVTGWDNGLDTLKDGLAYDRRRLKKAWRIYRSDNPDAELERDETEDNND